MSIMCDISRSAGCKSYLSKGIMDDLKDGSNIQSTVKRLDINSGKSQDLVRVEFETERFFESGEKNAYIKRKCCRYGGKGYCIYG